MAACASCLVVPPAAALDFPLPTELEAKAPPATRDDVRLLVTAGPFTRSAHFRELSRYLRPGDLLVVNDSQTLAASVRAHGARADFDLHLSTEFPDPTNPRSYRLHRGGTARWVVEPRKYTPAAGETVALDGGARVTFIEPYSARDARLWAARLWTPQPLLDWLAAVGKPIAYGYAAPDLPLAERQTIFARTPGSAEMPSAGRPFTAAMVGDLERAGIGFATLTLHTGVASQEAGEAPYAEYYDVPAETVARVSQTRERGGRVVAVGTTVVRALESALDEGQTRGWTRRVVSADCPPRFVDGLLTGLHEPRASHLAMLASFCALETLRRAYDTALRERFLWHEFGDVHLILP